MKITWRDCKGSECYTQAMDRVHRVGQKRDVRVVRFMTKHTVEERILELQVTHIRYTQTQTQIHVLCFCMNLRSNWRRGLMKIVWTCLLVWTTSADAHV